MSPIKSVSSATFRARCLSLFDEVRDHGPELVVTKHGKAVVRVVPVRRATRAKWPFPDLSGHLTGELGDVVTPLSLEWEATT